MSDVIETAVRRLEDWLVRHGYRGYEPYDALMSPLRPVFVGRLGRQAAIQIVRRAPWNLRPALGIRPARSAKGIGYIARACLARYAVTGRTDYQDEALRLLDWLRRHAAPGYHGLAWGNHFDYQTRLFYLPRETPTVVWSALIGHAFLDAFDVTGDGAHLETAASVGRFITTDLERRRAGAGVCISYIPTGWAAVHNANMLAAGMLARTFARTGDDALRSVARAAVAYTVGAQRSDGSWWYGEAPHLHWVDTWHTAYVLDSLWWYMASTGDDAWRPAFERGARFWLDHFFFADGTPRYYADRTFPIEIQGAAQAIESLTLLAAVYDPSCLARARRVAEWTIRHMQLADGHFAFRKTTRWTNTTPMLHWGQGTMFLALAALQKAEREVHPAPHARPGACRSTGAGGWGARDKGSL